ncbi:aerotaxis receptor Aer [Luteococcus sp. Sow4_B9]|uniref:aerotaxis receptor Aer n=1 Tax=Luteococcus sp. Sow4_B9 TaxID=3438792 RepID=UPI003F9481EA
MLEQQPAAIEIAPDELFFSTTDSRGVIEKANSVFVRLSRHPWESLVGAPHNIIRHDDMPGGAFRLMWQTLQQGRPFCAYVVNQAADGAPYTVFATITPLGDGYLSVRSRPCVDGLLQTALGLYARTREVERARLAEGDGAPAAAVVGLETLASLLQDVGIADYEDFVRAALPAEVQARSALVSGLAVREGQGPLFGLLDSVRGIDAQLVGWTTQMDRLAELTESLARGVAELDEVMAASSQTAREVTEQAGDGNPIMLAVNVWASMMPEIEAALAELVKDLQGLAASSAETRFRIALARLHNDATGQFVVELIDAGRGTGAAQGSGIAAITDLARALDEGMVHTGDQGRRNAELAEQVASRIESVRELMLVPQGLLGNWQEMAQDRQDSQASALIPRMAGQMAEGDRAAGVLAELAEQCRAQAQPLDIAGIDQELRRIRTLVEEVSGEQMVTTSRRAARAMPEDDEPVDDPVDEQRTPGPRRGV